MPAEGGSSQFSEATPLSLSYGAEWRNRLQSAACNQRVEEVVAPEGRAVGVAVAGMDECPAAGAFGEGAAGAVEGAVFAAAGSGTGASGNGASTGKNPVKSKCPARVSVS